MDSPEYVEKPRDEVDVVGVAPIDAEAYRSLQATVTETVATHTMQDVVLELVRDVISHVDWSRVDNELLRTLRARLDEQLSSASIADVAAKG